MIPLSFKSAHHIRVKPLSITDKRAILIPAVRPRPLHQIVQRPKPVNKPLSVTRPINRSQPPLIKPPNSKLERFKDAGFGRVLVIVGNGPSHKLAELERLKEIKTIDIMSINKPDDRLWPTTFWLFCDQTQLDRHRELWTNYERPIFNTPSVREDKGNTIRLRSIGNMGFSLDATKGVHIGSSSVFAAMQVGHWMGYSSIYIYGCDMVAVEGKLYPWGQNPDVADDTREKRFPNEAKSYQWAADHLPAEIRAKFTFCTSYNPWPFVEQFNRLDHAASIDEILARHNPPQT